MTASTLRELGPHYVIAPPGAEAAGLAEALAPVRAEPRALLLLAAAADAAPVLLASLDDLVRAAGERDADVLVLAASGLAAIGPDGRRPAELLAARSGLTIVAPDAVVSIETDGTLSAGGGSWWRCPPGGAQLRAEPLGARWPAAATITPLARDAYWVTETAGRARPAALDHAAATDDGLLLVLGEPDGRLPTGAQLANAAALLLGTVAEDARLTLSAPWAAPVELIELAAVSAASLGREVRAAVGLPVRGTAGLRHVHLAADGTEGWEPYLTELVACPTDRTVTAVGWRSRPDLPAAPGPARYPAFPGWELEAVAAGLWLRPAATADRGPRLRRPDPGHPVLVVGSPGRPVPESVWDHLGAVLGALPPAPARLALAVAGTLDIESGAVGRFCARLYGLDWVGPAAASAAGPVAAPAPGPEVAPALVAGPAPVPAAELASELAPEPASAELGALPEAEAGSETDLAPLPVPTESWSPEPVAEPDPAFETGTATEPGTETGTATEPETGTDPVAVPVPMATMGVFGGEPGEHPAPAPVPAPEPVAAVAGDGGTTVAPDAGTGRAVEPEASAAPGGGDHTPPTEDPDLGAGSAPAAASEEAAAAEEVPAPDPVLDPVPVPVASVSVSTEATEATEAAEATGTTVDRAGAHSTPGPAAGSAPEQAPAQAPEQAPAQAPEQTPVPPIAPSPDLVELSTPAEDRAALVALLGPAYQRFVRRAEDVATRLPGLRARADEGDPRPELVAVLLHHTDSTVLAERAELRAAARSGAPGPFGPYLRCLAAGLRRLPSHYGGVLVVGPAESADLAAYTPGTVLTERAPVSGLAAPGADFGEDVGVEFAIWSVGGRRSSAFGEPGDQPTVIFAPGTEFEVVDVDLPDETAGRPARVLLHEIGGVRPRPDRLRSWLARRDAVAPADRIRPADPARYLLDLGGAAGR
ncbi:hypothetical protein ACIPLC_10675 [Kitasatospora sp. NPDC086801]|uniref:hypothetical protein n=1 Tax=Kitasatospora sp. NPDC086801 TaxID=3364066 RepID=UPI0037F79103